MNVVFFTTEINGRQVNFYPPPHYEPDFLWVDAYQLARAFLPKAAARKLVEMSMSRSPIKGAATRIRSGDRMVAIVSHPIAQALLGAVDQLKSGIDEDGPAYSAYCQAAADMNRLHRPMPVGQLIEAMRNAGGPILRKLDGGRHV